MMSRGFASAARRVSFATLIIACCISVLSGGWASLTVPAGTAPVLGPSARTALASSRAVTPGLINLTYSPAAELAPAWSPSGQFIAFTSDGVDTNNDGRIDTAGNTRALYTMKADGSGLDRYPLAAGAVTALAWNADGTAVYLAVNAGGVYTIQRMTLATKTAEVVYAATGAIGALATSKNGANLLFDMVSPDGRQDIYLLPLTPANAPVQQLTARTGNNRQPSFSADNTEILFATNRSGRWRLYRMSLDGTNPTALTTAVVTGDDTAARATADGRVVFASTRLTVAGDSRADSNVWVMSYGQEGAGTPAITPVPRFFADPGDTATQDAPAPCPTPAQADSLLFVSTATGNADIYLGQMTDADAPYITQPATATPKVSAPGAQVTISVPVLDAGTGVRGVWLQVKDPDTAATDLRGANHVLTVKNAAGFNLPVEFGPFNPITSDYLDLALATSHPGYYARAGAARLFSDEGTGYPTVPTHWVKMYDDRTHGDLVAGDDIYTCQWTTPANSSDWYFDIITEDNTCAATDTANAWHGNRRRFDNVGGCSTAIFTGARRLLLVDDYMDGQRFLTIGLPPVVNNYDPAAYLNSPCYFLKEKDTTADPTPFAAGSEFGGADIWRLLARGPLPDAVLNAYLPTQVTQPAPATPTTNTTVRHGDKVVVWSSPSAWNHLVGPAVGGTGSLMETTVQAQLSAFANNGGRLFIIGPDLVSGLTATGTKTNSFVTNTLAAKLLKTSLTFTAAGQAWTMREPHALINEAGGYWYGYTLALPRWATVPPTGAPTRGVSVRNDNPSQYLGYNAATGTATGSVWDHLDNTTESNGGICACTFLTSSTRGLHQHDSRGTGDTWDVVSTSKDKFTNGGRLIFWSFGYEHITQNTGNALALDTLEWLQDGAVSGTVVRLNDLQPIPNALVTINEVTTVTVGTVVTDRLKAIAAARTDALGRYTIYGVRSARKYRLVVAANGYFGTLSNDIAVKGGIVNSSNLSNFFLSRDTNPAILWGYVTQNAVPVAGATVTAVPVGGTGTSTTTTDATGRYEFTTLASGTYRVTATHPLTSLTSDAAPNPTLAAGETQRADILLTVSAPNPSTLSGVVTGSGVPIAGATVQVKQNGTLVTQLTSDLNGAFSLADPDAGTYELSVSAAGFLGLTRTVIYDPVTGARVTLDLTPISDDPVTGRITGRVYEAASGTALGGATVDLLVGATVKATQTSLGAFQAGTLVYNFDFTVASGSYQLRVSKTGFRTQTLAVTLSPGETLFNIEFRMEPLLTVDAGVALFSLPGDYTQMTTSAIFGLTPGQAGALGDWLATYDTANMTYARYTAANPLPLLPGRGYWAKLAAPLTVSAEGVPADTTQPYQLQLQHGWNLIGNPYPFTVDLYECGLLLDGAAPLTWPAAVTAGKVGNALFTWNGLAYVPSTMMQPYRGYWLYVTAKNGTIRLAVSNRSTTRAAEVTRATRRAPTASAWQVRLEARAGDYRDGANYFGVSADALDGFSNRHDLREPPLPIGGYVSLAFPHRAWGDDSGDFSSDLRAPGAGEKRWQLRVTSNQANAEIVLAWPELAAQLPSGLQATLRDLTTQQVVYLQTTGQYRFRAGADGATRDFELVVGPRAAGLVVGDVRGTNGGVGRAETLVSFTLTEAARVDVTIRTATGRLVRTLATNLAADAGITTLAWDRRDAAGHAVPAGSYLVEVRAGGSGGRLARGTGLVTLVSLR